MSKGQERGGELTRRARGSGAVKGELAGEQKAVQVELTTEAEDLVQISEGVDTGEGADDDLPGGESLCGVKLVSRQVRR